MCTLSLSDMGELRDEWLREPERAALPPAESDPAVLALLAELGRNLPLAAPPPIRDAA